MIKNLIFDFGGVILNLDIPRTRTAFQSFFPDKAAFHDVEKEFAAQRIYERYETGELSTEEFVRLHHEAAPATISPQHVMDAWNVMLLDLPQERIDFLKALRAEGYRLFLFSNINDLHLTEIRQIIIRDCGDLDFDSLFEQAYYSHLVGKRKPDLATFEWILAENHLDPSETLFIDDNEDNIVSSTKTGIQVLFHTTNSDLQAAVRRKLQELQ